MSMAMFGQSVPAHSAVHFEFASRLEEFKAVHFEGSLLAAERDNEVVDPQVAVCAADLRPLLILCQE